MPDPRAGRQALVWRDTLLVVTVMKLLVALLVLSGLAPVPGEQSLADAARKAEEQRKANDKAPITVTQFDAPPLSEVLLNRNVVDTYVNARSAMAKLWHRDPPLYQRIRAGGAAVERLRDFGQILGSEPLVVDLLKFYNLTPDAAIDIEVTLRRALARTEGGYGKLTDVESQNSAYMGKDLGYVQYAIRHYYSEEAGMHAWPEWVPY